MLAWVWAAMLPDLQLDGSLARPACSLSLYVAAWGLQGEHCCRQSGQLQLLHLLAAGWCLYGNADEVRHWHASQSMQSSVT